MNQKCIKEMIFFRLQSKILIESLIISFKLAIENDVSSQNATKIFCIALKLLSCIRYKALVDLYWDSYSWYIQA